MANEEKLDTLHKRDSDTDRFVMHRAERVVLQAGDASEEEKRYAQDKNERCQFQKGQSATRVVRKMGAITGMVANSQNLPEQTQFQASSTLSPVSGSSNTAASVATGMTKPRLKSLTAKQWGRIVHTAAQFAPRLAKEMEQFWGHGVRVSFFAASTDTQYFWRLDDFFVAQAPLTKERSSSDVLQLRLSEEACSDLLTEVLGTPKALKAEIPLPFSFSQLTNFEGHLLNHFAKDILKLGLKQLVDREQLAQSSKKGMNTLGLMLHLIWTVELVNAEPEPPSRKGTVWARDTQGGKLILSMPLVAFKPEQTPVKDTESGCLTEEPLRHAHVPAVVHIGSTRAKLDDLKALELDDMLLLESSQTSQMCLVHWNDKSQVKSLFPFSPRISNAYDLEIPYTQEIAMMETNTQTQQAMSKQDLWENLEIDVAAEFFPSKIPLKQLRQMSEGEVVEVADLVRNQVRIHVEGRTVALGELVIVGDKFGVRVTQLNGLSPYDTPNPSKTQMMSPMQTQQGPSQMGGMGNMNPSGLEFNPSSNNTQMSYGDPQGSMGGGSDYGDYGDPSSGGLPNPDDLDSMLNSNFDNDSEGW
jgi:flagellar motor switch/type III secretory pathway protein FliN